MEYVKTYFNYEIEIELFYIGLLLYSFCTLIHIELNVCIILDGFLFPDRANLFLTGIEDGHRKDEKINWWGNVYGFNMSSICNVALSEPSVNRVTPEQVKTKFNLKLPLNFIYVILILLGCYKFMFVKRSRSVHCKKRRLIIYCLFSFVRGSGRLCSCIGYLLYCGIHQMP